MEVLSKSTEQTKKLAEQLVPKIKSGTVIALYGDLGSGKTTFVKYLAEALGSKSKVQSPTFVLIRTYKTTKDELKKIHHVDLYRITDATELNNLGLEELISDPQSICIIEWPDIAKEILPIDTIKVYFEYAGENIRKISCKEFDV